MKELLFIGGAKGVGKTTIIDYIQKNISIMNINTGKIYLQAKKENKNPEEEIIAFLEKYNGIIDTHYAGYDATGFVRGISTFNLQKLAQTKSIDLILVETDKVQLMLRRNNDIVRERILDEAHATNELSENAKYFFEYCKDLNIPGFRISNNDAEETAKKILERVLYGR